MVSWSQLGGELVARTDSDVFCAQAMSVMLYPPPVVDYPE